MTTPPMTAKVPITITITIVALSGSRNRLIQSLEVMLKIMVASVEKDGDTPCELSFIAWGASIGGNSLIA